MFENKGGGGVWGTFQMDGDCPLNRCLFMVPECICMGDAQIP